MTEKELGKKIRKARERLGLKQDKVEERLGFSQKALTRIETGQRLPSTVELTKLAELFHMPIGEFFQEEIIEEDPLVALYRTAPGLEKDPKIREEVALCAHLCKEGIFLEKLLEQPSRKHALFYSFEKPSNASEAIRQGEIAAKEERKRLGIGSIPIRDIAEIISSQGIWCSATRLSPEISGVFLYHTSIGMAILVNSSHVNSRRRFSYAHEYAHALFDADHKILVSNANNNFELIEKRANAFAAAFLMPDDGIKEVMNLLNKGFASKISSSIFDVSNEGVIEAEERNLAKNQKLSFQDAAFIAHRFGVSYQATVYRLQSLGYLSQEERENLLDDENKGKNYLSLLGLEELEKTEKKHQRELKTYIVHLVIEAYRQEKISRGRLIEFCKLLKLSPQDLLELASSN